jgi:two-component system, NarL family, invasion response regulator UvrY
LLYQFIKMKKEKLAVLVVDADFAVASHLTDMLYRSKPVGLVLHASNYSEAVSVLRQRNISVLVASVILPGRTGIELLRTVRDTGHKAQVIMTCSNPNNYYRELCRSLGAAYFFDKADDLSKLPFIVSGLQMDGSPGVN